MEPGWKYVYQHADGYGFGEAVKVNAGEGGITAEMSELDLKNDQEVTFLQLDEDSGWPIIEWTDGVGINRITTIDPELFDSNFHEV